jgi:glycosyltransferase involved in cell wall biosynthesis
MTVPVTSVMMPAYNAAETIRDSIDSALAQTVQNLELIVVDDGSTDGTSEVVAEIDDPRLRLVRHQPNRGVSAARNAALAAARAPLVSVLDADDTWDPDYLETVLPALDDPGVGLVYANCRFRRNLERDQYLPHLADVDLGITEPWLHPVDTFPEISRSCPVTALTVTMRAEAARRVGGYAPWLACGSDWYLYLRLVKAGWRFAYVDRVLATYRWPEPGVSISFDVARRELNDLKLWTRFALEHPTTPGAWPRVARDLRRVVTRRAPALGNLKRAAISASGGLWFRPGVGR